MAHKNKAQIENKIKTPTVVEKETQTKFKHSIWATERDLQELASELIEYVRNTPDCFSIDYFCNYKNMNREVFYSYVKKNPDMANALVMAKQLIFERREKGAIMGKLAPNTIMPYLHMYSPEYKEHSLYMASLNKKEDERPTQITVIMEPFGQVPPKLGEGEKLGDKKNE